MPNDLRTEWIHRTLWQRRNVSAGASVEQALRHADYARHQIAVAVDPVPAAGTLRIRGIPANSQLPPVKISDELDAVNLTLGNRSFLFHGVFEQFEIAPISVSAGTLVSVHLTSTGGDLMTAVGAVGPPGSAGPPGPAGASYEHTQSSPALTWTVNHNLGFNPQVQVFTVGGLEVIAEIQHTTLNQTVIRLTESLAGLARFN
jgi:hypothetical protein